MDVVISSASTVFLFLFSSPFKELRSLGFGAWRLEQNVAERTVFKRKLGVFFAALFENAALFTAVFGDLCGVSASVLVWRDGLRMMWRVFACSSLYTLKKKLNGCDSWCVGLQCPLFLHVRRHVTFYVHVHLNMDAQILSSTGTCSFGHVQQCALSLSMRYAWITAFHDSKNID